jgi:hypothetical protein
MPHFVRRLSGTLPVQVVVLTIGAGLLLAGCSDEADQSGSPQSQETTSAATTSPTEDGLNETPSVQPATGPVLTPETGGITVRLPEGWKIDHADSFVVDGSKPLAWARISLTSFPSLDPDIELTRQSRIALDHSWMPQGSILPPVLLNGELVYHLAGKGKSPRQEEYGTVIDGNLVYVRFELDDVPKDKRQALIDSVLATVEWG